MTAVLRAAGAHGQKHNFVMNYPGRHVDFSGAGSRACKYIGARDHEEKHENILRANAAPWRKLNRSERQGPQKVRGYIWCRVWDTGDVKKRAKLPSQNTKNEPWQQRHHFFNGITVSCSFYTFVLYTLGNLIGSSSNETYCTSIHSNIEFFGFDLGTLFLLPYFIANLKLINPPSSYSWSSEKL